MTSSILRTPVPEISPPNLISVRFKCIKKQDKYLFTDPVNVSCNDDLRILQQRIKDAILATTFITDNNVVMRLYPVDVERDFIIRMMWSGEKGPPIEDEWVTDGNLGRILRNLKTRPTGLEEFLCVWDC